MQLINGNEIGLLLHAVNHGLVDEILDDLGVEAEANNLERFLLLWNLFFANHEYFANFMNDVQSPAAEIRLVDASVRKIVDLRLLLIILLLEP